MVAILTRVIPVRVIEVGRTGCLLESRFVVDPGTRGELVMRVDGSAFTDVVRVCRVAGGGSDGPLNRMGVEFVGGRGASQHSIRWLIRREADGH